MISINFICGWKKPIGSELMSWQQRENKELSEQRGSFERHIGRLVSKFKILRKKYRNNTNYIRDIFYFIFSIHNLDNFIHLIMKNTLEMHDEDFNEHINQLSLYLAPDILHLETTKNLQRHAEEREALRNCSSVSSFLIQFENEVNNNNLSINIEEHQSQHNTPYSNILSAIREEESMPRTRIIAQFQTERNRRAKRASARRRYFLKKINKVYKILLVVVTLCLFVVLLPRW